MTRTPSASSYSAGEKGRNRVRLYPHATSGRLYLEWINVGGSKRRRALGHQDWHLGKSQADALAADLGTTPRATEGERLTLGALFEIYEREVTPEKGRTSQKHDRAAAALFQRCWGAQCLVTQLGQIEWGRFIRARRCGALAGAGAVGNRTIEYDLRFVLAVLNWAVKGRLLRENPCAGLEIPREYDPRQPMLSPAEYEALQRVAPGVSARFALALTLAWETGRRIGSIRHLRWSDVDFTHELLLFRKQHDKNKRRARDAWVPLSAPALVALRGAKAERERPTLRIYTPSAERDVPVSGARIGDGWIFASAVGEGAPMGRRYFLSWWKKAEQRAGLEPLRGRAWHSCRRAFSTELLGAGAPDEVVNALGGWARGSNVAREIYQHAQLEQQRAVIRARGA